MREWFVAGALIETDGKLLLVRNVRKDGRIDWSPPGGVIERHAGESVTDGLWREVKEETGLSIDDWGHIRYRVEVVAPDLGWIMTAEVHHVVSYSGELDATRDPDGIVSDAAFVAPSEASVLIGNAHRWVHEPLSEWMETRFDQPREFRYHMTGRGPSDGRITRR